MATTIAVLQAQLVEAEDALKRFELEVQEVEARWTQCRGAKLAANKSKVPHVMSAGVLVFYYGHYATHCNEQ